MNYVIVDPDTGKPVMELDDEDKDCCGGWPCPCGGCNRCLIAQAGFSGWDLVDAPRWWQRTWWWLRWGWR